jgi:hypothetical protein
MSDQNSGSALIRADGTAALMGVLVSALFGVIGL